MRKILLCLVIIFVMVITCISSDIQIIITKYPRSIKLGEKSLTISVKVINESSEDYVLKGFKYYSYFESVNCIDYSDSFKGKPVLCFALIDTNGRSVDKMIPMTLSFEPLDSLSFYKELEKSKKIRTLYNNSDLCIKAKEALIINGTIDIEYVNIQPGNYTFKALYFNKISSSCSSKKLWVGCTSSNIVKIRVVK